MPAAPAIRTLTPAEVERLVDWAAGEGWNPGFADAIAFHAADPEGFLGAFVDGEMVAGIAAVAYGEDFGFIGLYICRPGLRGKGYGRAVWDAGMARLEGRSVGLDGVPGQQANYRSMGFVASYRTVRFSGRLGPRGVDSAIQPLRPYLLPAAFAFDRRFFPASREAFLDRWLRPPHTALALVRDGSLAGYGVARRCRDGFKVGPLFAKGDEDAESLFAALAASVDGVVHLDVPETAERFSSFLRAEGFAEGFETARMYRGPAPAAAEKVIHAVTSLELG